MKPTRAPVLVVTGVICGLLAALLLAATYDRLAALPVGVVITVALVAVAEAFLAAATRNRRAGKEGTRPVEPLQVARYAALARASSLVGVGSAGAWVGVLAYLAGRRGSLDVIVHDRLLAIAGVVVGLLFLAAALWLEAVCRITDGGQLAMPERD